MNARSTTWLWLALLTSGASIEALACGETVFRASSGMRPHMQAAHLPARILVVAEPADDMSNRRDDLYRALRLAGHSVEEISGAEALAQAIDGKEFDLILAHQSEVPAVVSLLDDGVDAQASAPTRRPTVIPVLAKGQRAPESFRVSLNQDAEVGAFLRAIARAMRDATP